VQGNDSLSALGREIGLAIMPKLLSK
jgi:hypothetical protein